MPEDNLKRFLNEQSSIIRNLGAFGGRLKRRDILINAAFFTVVVACFAWSVLSHDEFYQRLLLELGILLISAKLAFFLWHFAKVAHFQFWALVALEAKLDILTGLGHGIKKHAKDVAEEGSQDEPQADS